MAFGRVGFSFGVACVAHVRFFSKVFVVQLYMAATFSRCCSWLAHLSRGSGIAMVNSSIMLFI